MSTVEFGGSKILVLYTGIFFFLKKREYSLCKVRSRWRDTMAKMGEKRVRDERVDGAGLHDGPKSKRGKAAMGGRWQNVGGVVCHMPHVCF